MAIIIPSRKYLTFEELRQRWQCTENDLRYLIYHEILKPALPSSPHRLLSVLHMWTKDDGGLVAEALKTEDGQPLKVSVPGWLYLQSPAPLGVLNCEFHHLTYARDPEFIPTEVDDKTWGTHSCFLLTAPLAMDKVMTETAFNMKEVISYENAQDHQSPGGNEDKPLGQRERDTLLKLVIGMAMKGYAYDPLAKKSPTPGEIESDLLKLGINVSDDTIRRYLKEAAARVLPAKQQQAPR